MLKEKDMAKKYKYCIRVRKTVYSTETVFVTAEYEAEAKSLAIQKAKNMYFALDDEKYEAVVANFMALPIVQELPEE